MKPLVAGLYDRLVTRSLQERQALTKANGEQLQWDKLDDTASPSYLIRHLADQIRMALRALPKKDRLGFANELAEFLHVRKPVDAAADTVPSPAQVLKAVYRDAKPPEAPHTPLSFSDLLMNSVGGPRLAYELESEMRNADRVSMIISFVKWRGWVKLKPAFEELAARGCSVRILTTTYIGATDLSALTALARLRGFEVKVSLDGSRRRLHAKAWLFERDSGYGSVYVGSANLSQPALEDGIEWTVKLSQIEAPHIVEKFKGAFGSLWEDAEFERFDPTNSDCVERVRAALERASGKEAPAGFTPTFFDLRPRPYQQEVLDQLTAEREDRGYWRNLVVAPTGTGKTMIAAFDYARQERNPRTPRLLFLAHREELLEQARKSFREVLRDGSFGEVLAGTNPASFQYLFATVQSFNSRNLLERCGPEYWQYVVMDEAHHVPARSYTPILEGLRPRILLGLTATPERHDGLDIRPWFDNRVADEMRLWHAIERQHVAPFDYFGIADNTDLENMRWQRGGYVKEDLEALYVHNEKRAGLVLEHLSSLSGNVSQVRALGFCVSIAHAQFMADAFNRGGVRAAAVFGESSDEIRRSIRRRLIEREVNVVFTVDLYNEGIDIPEVDCVLFLRPTESSTVYLQQLGRGLRLNDGKTSCLVLDFIGNQHKEFRFDLRYRALLGGTRRELEAGIESRQIPLPGNCYFRLDHESQRIILENLRHRIRGSRKRMTEEVKHLAIALKRPPTLSEYLAETSLEPEDLYRGQFGWSHLLEGAGLLPTGLGPDGEIAERFRRILHVDSTSRLKLYRALSGGTTIGDRLTEGERRTVLMLTPRLGQKEEFTNPRLMAGLVGDSPVAREFRELCDVLLDRIPMHVDEDEEGTAWPLVLHRRYTRDEILVAVGEWTPQRQPPSREGFYRLSEANVDLFFVTLDKSGEQYSPTTRYADYALSPGQFHWQSQSTTSEDSRTGLRYREQRQNGSRFLLFVRGRRGEAYYYLGPVRYLSHEGSRPMSIVWNLETPMPASVFELSATLRSA